jgi:hypothetical protein
MSQGPLAIPFDRHAHHVLLAKLSLLWAVRQEVFGGDVLILIAAATRSQREWERARAGYMQALRRSATVAGYEWASMEPLVKSYVAALKKEWLPRAPPRSKREADASDAALSDLLKRGRDPVLCALARIPSSVPKAISALAAHLETELAQEDALVFPDVLQVLASSDPALVDKHRKRIRRYILSEEPRGRTGYSGTEWQIAWIKYAERHELPHARVYVQEACEELENEVREQGSHVWTKPEYDVPPQDYRGVLRLFWISSFSQSLRARCEQIVGNALRTILTWRRTDGAWPDASRGGEGACAETTAFAASCLQRYGDGAEWRAAAEQATSWLLAHPNEGGGWGDPKRMGGSGPLNMVATVAALDAMRVQGVPLEHPTIEQAERALIQQQAPTGMWVDYRGHAEEYVTSLVLSYFQRREQRLSGMHEVARLGRGLLLKAQAMQMRVYATDQMLALISLYHGLEYTVYAFLIAVGIPIRRPDGRTIGLDEGLSQFRTWARVSGLIGSGAGLPHDTEISEMKARRDEVIHRMSQVQPEAVQKFTAVVWKFVERFDVPVLGYTLLD